MRSLARNHLGAHSITSRSRLTAASLLAVSLLVTLTLSACSPVGEIGMAASDSDSDSDAFPVLTGPWLGQIPPGGEPQIFAPGLISTGMYVRDLAASADGDEIFYTLMLPQFEHSALVTTRLADGAWSRPEVASFSGSYKDMEPALSADGSKLFFASFRPRSGLGPAREDSDIWVVERTETGWGEPYNPGEPLNSDQSEFFPSVTRDGTVWFTRETDARDSITWRSRFADGAWQEPERLPDEINAGAVRFNVFVAPDESYAIIPIYGRDDSFGATDYYVSFRNEDDSWSGPFHLDERVNSPGGVEYSAYVSADGRYLFFMAARSRFDGGVAEPPMTYDDLLRFHLEPGYGNPSIWWVGADLLEELRPTAGN